MKPCVTVDVHRPAAFAILLALLLLLPAGTGAASARDRDRDGMPDRWEVRYKLNPRLARDAKLNLDRDGMWNVREFRVGTNPRVQDTDGDRINDGTEVKKYRTDPLKRDTDRDGLNDYVEVTKHRTYALVVDTDGDGLEDGAEVKTYRTNPLVADTDGDGLIDGAEIERYRTDPLKRDTDRDGLWDGVDPDPLVPNHDAVKVPQPSPPDPTKTDTDGDGLTDAREAELGTDPTKADSDGDTLSDGAEVNTHHTDPTLADTDGDGTQDAIEIAAFADPLVSDKTTRLSVASSGTQGDGASGSPSISGDGRYIAFQSSATNLVAGDTNANSDVFVHDRQSGQTTRVSVNSAGVQGNEISQMPAITADGRYVVFASRSTNLVTPDANGTFYDIFRHDRLTGQTIRVNENSVGTQGAGTNAVPVPSISADGRYIAWRGGDGGLVAGDNNGVEDVFVKDMQTGAITRASVNSAGDQASSGLNQRPSLSADGRYVAFSSTATNLVAGDTNGTSDLFRHDMQTGQTIRVTLTGAGQQSSGATVTIPSLSGDGNRVAWFSTAFNLVPGDTNGLADVFVRDIAASTTIRVMGVGGAQPAGGAATSVSISADGNQVAYASLANNMVAGDTNNSSDMFIYDHRTGETIRANVSSSGDQVSGGAPSEPRLSADGRFVTWHSAATNLVTTDTNGFVDVFLRRLF